MSVVRRLERCRNILLKIADRPDCAEITGYTDFSINIFVDGLTRAIKHYESEARRVSRYYRK